MMHVKVKVKDIRFTIPVPYAILNIVLFIVSSNFFQQHVNRWSKAYSDRKKIDLTLPQIDKKMLMPIIKELKNYKGTVLVDVKAKDGTEVKVRL